MAPSNIDRLQFFQKQEMRMILGVPQSTSAKMMRHKLHMLPVEHRAKLSRAKLYRKIRGNTNHPLHTTINRRQRNEWTIEIQECHRLASRQFQEPTQLQRDDTAPWDQLPYECRIYWIRGGNGNTETEISRVYTLSTRRHYVLDRRFKWRDTGHTHRL